VFFQGIQIEFVSSGNYHTRDTSMGAHATYYQIVIAVLNFCGLRLI